MKPVYPHNANELPRKIKDMTRDLFTYAFNHDLIERPNKCELCGIACIPEGHHINYFENRV